MKEIVFEELADIGDRRRAEIAKGASREKAPSVSISTMIGQDRFKPILKIHTDPKKEIPFPHSLFYGNAGLGKTHLARLVASLNGGTLHERTAEGVSVKEIRETLKNLRDGDVLFLDEIHSIKLGVAEELYTPMQGFMMDGQPIARFTLIGATTDAGDVPAPMFQRFKIDYEFSPYSVGDLCKILKMEYPNIGGLAREEIAKRSFGTPRIALKYGFHVSAYLRKFRAGWRSFLTEILGVMDNGFTDGHVKILLALNKKGEAVSLDSVACLTSLSVKDIKRMYEPQLLSLGYIERTPRGRLITTGGKIWLKEK